MPANPLLQAGLDLSEEILDVNIEVDREDLKEDWNQVAFFYLRQANRALRAINIILPHGLVTPSEVLVRYLFELGVRLRYMEASPGDRVPDFLRHIHPTDPADSDLNDQIRDQLEHGNYEDAMKSMVPGQGWRDFRKMCEEFKLLNDYWTVYRVSSERTHGGGLGMANDLLVALGLYQVPDSKAPGILYTAIHYYTWVVDINLKAFPHRASGFSLSADWKDRLQAFGHSVESMTSTS